MFLFQAFLVLLVASVNFFLVTSIARFFLSKPLLRQTVLDLIDADFFRIYGITVSCGCLGLAVRWLLPVPIPTPVGLVMAWLAHFSSQAFFLYFFFGIFIQYLHVIENRMLFEEVPDRVVCRCFRTLASVLSLGLCLLIHLAGEPPITYRYLTWQCEAQCPSGNMMPLLGLLVFSVIINIILRIHMNYVRRTSLKSGSSNTGDQNNYYKGILFMIACIVAMSLFSAVIGNGSNRRITALFLIGNVIPAAILKSDPKKRKFVFAEADKLVPARLKAVLATARNWKPDSSISPSEQRLQHGSIYSISRSVP